MVDRSPRRVYDARTEIPLRGKNVLVNPGHSQLLADRLTSFSFERYKRGVVTDKEKGQIDTYTLLTPAFQRKIASRESEQEASALVEAIHQELTQTLPLESFLDVVDKLINRSMFEKAQEQLQLIEGRLTDVHQLLRAARYFLDNIADSYDRFANEKTDKFLAEIKVSVDQLSTYQSGERQANIKQRIKTAKQKIAESTERTL